MAYAQNPSSGLMPVEIYDSDHKAGQVLVEGDMVIAENVVINMGTCDAGTTASARFKIPAGYYVISSVVYQSGGNGFAVQTDNYNDNTAIYAVWLRADTAMTNAMFQVNLVLMRSKTIPMQPLS